MQMKCAETRFFLIQCKKKKNKTKRKRKNQQPISNTKITAIERHFLINLT